MAGEDDFYRSVVDHIQDGVYFVDLERRITYWNDAAARITGFSRDEVLGRSCRDNILMHVDDGGRVLCRELCPLAKTLADGRLREQSVYCHHKGGHRQPVTVRTAPVRDPAGKIVGAVEIFNDSTEMTQTRRRIEELQKLALYDPLTGVGNRRYLDLTLESKLDELRRFGWAFAALILDIDDFKSINDRHGHPSGDHALLVVANTLSFNSRATDVVSRWGGDEFAVLLGAVEQDSLPFLAERLRSLIAASRVHTDGEPFGVTVSIGASMARPGDDGPALLERADRLLYRSKTAGKNRVTIEPPREPSAPPR